MPFEKYEEFEEWAQDIVCHKRFEPLLKNLFEKEQGIWHAVKTLDASMLDNPLHLQWTDHPTDSGMAIVIIGHLDNSWSTMAIYNSQRLLRD